MNNQWLQILLVLVLGTQKINSEVASSGVQASSSSSSTIDGVVKASAHTYTHEAQTPQRILTGCRGTIFPESKETHQIFYILDSTGIRKFVEPGSNVEVMFPFYTDGRNVQAHRRQIVKFSEICFPPQCKAHVCGTVVGPLDAASGFTSSSSSSSVEALQTGSHNIQNTAEKTFSSTSSCNSESKDGVPISTSFGAGSFTSVGASSSSSSITTGSSQEAASFMQVSETKPVHGEMISTSVTNVNGNPQIVSTSVLTSEIAGPSASDTASVSLPAIFDTISANPENPAAAFFEEAEDPASVSLPEISDSISVNPQNHPASSLLIDEVDSVKPEVSELSVASSNLLTAEIKPPASEESSGLSSTGSISLSTSNSEKILTQSSSISDSGTSEHLSEIKPVAFVEEASSTILDSSSQGKSETVSSYSTSIDHGKWNSGCPSTCSCCSSGFPSQTVSGTQQQHSSVKPGSADSAPVSSDSNWSLFFPYFPWNMFGPSGFPVSGNPVNGPDPNQGTIGKDEPLRDAAFYASLPGAIRGSTHVIYYPSCDPNAYYQPAIVNYCTIDPTISPAYEKITQKYVPK